MTSLREAIRRGLRRPPQDETGDPSGSYRFHWTGQAWTWTAEHRTAVLRAAQELVDLPGFEPNAYQRHSRLPELDSSAHAGASLAALREVLLAMSESDTAGRHPQPTSFSDGGTHERQY